MTPTHLSCRGEVSGPYPEGYFCKNCNRILGSKEVRRTQPFIDCVSGVSYVGVNTIEDAKEIINLLK